LTPDSTFHPAAPADASFLPGPVLLLGAPGVGKGTQAQLLVAAYGIPQISTGDILRAIKQDPVKAKTKQGLMARGLMEQGLLVPDELVNDLVADRLAEPDTARGYILDGYPRTLPQAMWLDGHLGTVRATLPPRLPVVAINIAAGYEQLLLRITGRRICSTCKSIYNIYSNPPKDDGLCDLDGCVLTQRSDDTEPVFVERMKTFEEQTAPVISHYRALGRFREANGDLPVDQVIAAIDAALHELRQAAGR
jgi:adenylate kinase